jgi:hypothetical protein
MRCSTAVAYLNPAKARPNLTVMTDCMIRRVIVENRRATGVEIIVDDTPANVTMLTDLLEINGYLTIQATSGPEALDQLKREDLGMEVPPEMPMGAVISLLERAGYAVHVQEPRFVFRRLTPAEREQRASPAPVDPDPPR